MKILWLAPIPFVNEKDVHPAPWVMSLAELLIYSGQELTILNYSSDINNEVEILNYKKIKLIYIKVPKLKIDFLTLYKYRIFKVKHYLKNIINEYDILHIHGSEHQYEVMAKDLNIPKLLSIQGIMEEYIKYIPQNKFKQKLEWNLSAYYESKYLSTIDNFSCRTYWDSEHVKKKNPNAIVYMIWEMIREEFFSDNFNENSNKILFVGGKNPIKGLKELLIAYNNVLQELGLKIIVLGNCTTLDLQEIISSNNLLKINLSNIECRGMQDSKGMIKAYNESFCLAHPTYIDNSPNSICEAQISGLPVVATDVGGVSSLIENDETGLLVNNIEELGERIKKLYLDKDLFQKISENSKTIARERHNKETIVNQTLQMYHKVIRRKNEINI